MNKHITDDAALYSRLDALNIELKQVEESLKLQNAELIRRLPIEGVAVVRACEGSMGASLPQFSINVDGKYRWDSYGYMPPNYKKYNNTGGYGMAGSYGYTEDLALIHETIRLMNEKQQIIPCNQVVIDNLIAAGFQVEVTRHYGA
jgi:hypothetical protein